MGRAVYFSFNIRRAVSIIWKTGNNHIIWGILISLIVFIEYITISQIIHNDTFKHLLLLSILPITAYFFINIIFMLKQSLEFILSYKGIHLGNLVVGSLIFFLFPNIYLFFLFKDFLVIYMLNTLVEHDSLGKLKPTYNLPLYNYFLLNAFSGSLFQQYSSILGTIHIFSYSIYSYSHPH